MKYTALTSRNVEEYENLIRLEEITSGNWRLGLHVKETHKNYVIDPFRLLARAYAFRNHCSRVVVIYTGDEAVGMALQDNFDIRYLWRSSSVG